MQAIAQHGDMLLLLACFFGFFMAWGVGANDVSNAMGTSVGAKALTITQAICIAMVFEFAGAYLAGGAVTDTLRKGLIAPAVMTDHPDLLVYGMLASLLAAGTWLMVASIMGWPVSTTHSIVGAIIGFVAAGISVSAVNWGKVQEIALTWILSPVISGVIAYCIFLSVQKLILTRPDPFTRAKRLVPVYMFFVGLMLSLMTLTKGLKHVFASHHVEMNGWTAFGISCLIGVLVSLLGIAFLSRIRRDPSAEQHSRFASVEKVFAVLMVFTACAMAFAHGSNDVANAVGPLAAIVSVVGTGGQVLDTVGVPNWVLLLGAGGIVVGLVTYGYKVIATIGHHITELTPSRGFAAEIAAASTVVLASAFGMPVSTTHVLVGAVMGVGMARGISAINLRVIGGIFTSWLVTLPAGAFLSIMFFFMFKGMFGSS